MIIALSATYLCRRGLIDGDIYAMCIFMSIAEFIVELLLGALLTFILTR